MCSDICHQIGYKSFIINNLQFLVCARCTGIYSGAFTASTISLILENIFPKSIKYLALASLPLLLDVIFTTLEIYPYYKVLSFSTGIVFGYAVFYYILTGFEKLFAEIKSEEIF
jgi:uncharacterized membrane protein